MKDFLNSQLPSIIPPTSGLIVTTGYSTYKKRGYFSIFDLDVHCHVISNEEFRDVNSSDNVMGYIGITAALKLYNSKNVYCPNNYSVTWAKKRYCSSTMRDKKIDKLIFESSLFLGKKDLSDRIFLWNHKWGSAKLFINEHIKNLTKEQEKEREQYLSDDQFI